MEKEDLRIVFMGTPDFAVASLQALVENGYNVVGVITMPDKPAGRGYKLQPSAVKVYAESQHLPLLQPENLKSEAFLDELRAWKADLQIVVAFRMLPEVVWNMPMHGTFNLHASLLPQYRGAAPINWAIINGEKETGVTTFFLKHEIDTGKIIFQEKTAISEDDTAKTVHDRLMRIGANLVTQTVDTLLNGTVDTTPQEDMIPQNGILKSAPKIFKDTCRINWNENAETIHNFIRGLSPYPAAWTEIHRADAKEPMAVKVFASQKEITSHHHPAGQLLTDNKTHIKIAVPDGYIAITDLQVAGKKPMKVSDFLNGYTFPKEGVFVK